MNSHSKALAASLVLTLLLLLLPAGASARAGGGGGGAGGGGTGGGGGAAHTYTGYSGNSTNGSSNPIGDVINWLLFSLTVFSGAILFHVKLTKKKRKNERLMAKFDDADPAWRYGDIRKRVEKAFYVIQKGWSDRDLTEAGDYLSDDLRDQFSIKLEWMKVQGKRNILENIRLESVQPVAVNDSSDNSKDIIWFYVKARMIDYMVDENDFTILSGSKNAHPFVEYWMFTRGTTGWVLNRILQEDEGKKLFFDERTPS